MYKISIHKGKPDEDNVNVIEDATLYFFNEGDEFNLIKNPELSEIVEGGKVLVYRGYSEFIKTGEINKITKKKKELKLYTTDKVYLLSIS